MFFRPRRKRRTSTATNVSLFPFLAVLICTMGVLIVLLVMVTKLADQKAQETRAQHKAQQQRAIDEAEFQWLHTVDQGDGFENGRDSLLAKLQRLQTKRASVSAESRAIRRRIHALADEQKRLLESQKQLDAKQNQASAENQNERQRLQAFIDSLTTQVKAIMLEKEELENAVTDPPIASTDEPTRYSIVPTDYPGAGGGSARKPIYIECVEGKIILQPAGTSIHVDDFFRPIAAGNPLDVALLAIRDRDERLSQNSGPEPVATSYPLLIVRPGGERAFNIARRAMKSWEDQFGYELVEASKKLDFGKIDPEWKSELDRMIADSIQKQRLLKQFEARKMIAEARNPSTRTLQPIGLEVSSRGTFEPIGFAGIGTGRSSHSALDETHARSQLETKTGDDALAMQAPQGDQQSQQGPGGESRAASINSPSSDQANLARPAPTAASSSIDSPIDGRAGQSPNAQASSPGSGKNGECDSTTPLAKSRGANWGLPSNSATGTAYRRPISVVCTDHELIVANPTGLNRDPIRIDINDDMTAAADQLVQTVWTTIESWGIAAAGGYWKPELRVRVTDGGSHHLQLLQVLLDGSGVDVVPLDLPQLRSNSNATQRRTATPFAHDHHRR